MYNGMDTAWEFRSLESKYSQRGEIINLIIDTKGNDFNGQDYQ